MRHWNTNRDSDSLGDEDKNDDVNDIGDVNNEKKII